MKNWTSLLLILIIPIIAAGQIDDPKWTSYNVAIENESDPIQKVERILDLGYYALYYHPDSTMKYADEAQLLSSQNDYTLGMISAISLKGNHTKLAGQFDEAISYYNQAIELNKTLDNTLREAQLKDNIANVYIYQGKTDEAIALIKECLEVFRTEKDSHSIYLGLSGLGNLFGEKQDYLKGRKYFFDALSYCQSPQELAYSYGNIGIGYRHLNLPDSAIYYYEKGIQQGYDEPAFLARSYTNIAILHKSQKNLPEAKKSYDLALLYATQLGKENMIAKINVSAAYLDVEMEKYSEAFQKIRIAEPSTILYGSVKDKIELYKLKYTIFESTYQQDSALQNFKKYNILQDSLDNLALNTKIAAFETKYETAKKEVQIIQQKEKLLVQKNQRNILLGSLAAILWLGLFLAFYFWNRNRLTKVITKQERDIQNQKIHQLEQEKKILSISSMLEGQESERMRIAQDLHDSIGGLLTSVKAHFHVIEQELKKIESIKLTDQVNHLIDEASTEVRRISHNMAPRTLRLYGLKTAIQDLANQTQTAGQLDVTYEWNGAELEIGETEEIMLYRAIQELINNVQKHADAYELLIQINVFEGEINVIIEDNGKGFDFAKTKVSKSLGVSGIESRVEYLNGTIDFDSEIGKGTSVSFIIPTNVKPNYFPEQS